MDLFCIIMNNIDPIMRYLNYCNRSYEFTLPSCRGRSPAPLTAFNNYPYNIAKR